MTTKDQGFRKAAILIDSLDQASADALLERLTNEAADRIRRELLELQDVEPVERRRILAELSGGPEASNPAQPSEPAGDACDEPPVSAPCVDAAYNHPKQPLDTVSQLQPPHQASAPADNSAAVGGAFSAPEPFAFLDSTPMNVLAAYLSGEHPQAVSIVLAHLSPVRAAEYLATLSSERRADVLRRLARLDVTDADVISDVERGLQAVLADHVHAEAERPMGLATLEAILNAVGDEQRREFLGHLRSAAREPARSDSNDPSAASRYPASSKSTEATVFHARVSAPDCPPRTGNLLDALAAPACSSPGADTAGQPSSLPQGTEAAFEFEDFADLDDTALARIFRVADPQVSLLALCGAGRDLVDRILGRLPLREARALRRQIEQLGPTRLRDIESAQRRLADLAGRMADEGQIQVPGNRRFTGAA